MSFLLLFTNNNSICTTGLLITPPAAPYAGNPAGPPTVPPTGPTAGPPTGPTAGPPTGPPTGPTAGNPAAVGVNDIEELMPAHLADAIAKALGMPTVVPEPVQRQAAATTFLVPIAPATPHQRGAIQLPAQSPNQRVNNPACRNRYYQVRTSQTPYDRRSACRGVGPWEPGGESGCNTRQHQNASQRHSLGGNATQFVAEATSAAIPAAMAGISAPYQYDAGTYSGDAPYFYGFHGLTEDPEPETPIRHVHDPLWGANEYR